MTYSVESAGDHPLDGLPSIEAAAAELFPVEDLPPAVRSETLSMDEFRQAAEEGRLWLAIHRPTGGVDEPVGFALAILVDGSAHLAEMDVHPDHGRRGLGRRLVEAVLDWARFTGHPTVTLTTFRHLPWNGPFYARLGFRELPESKMGPELRQMLVQEAELGLDPARRVAMVVEVEIA